MDVDEKLGKIDEQLKVVETEISRLSAVRRKLNAAKEKLQEKKYLEKQNELANNNWNQGKFSELINLKNYYILMHFRMLSLV